MRIAVLGPLEVWSDDGRPVTVPGAKERLLLALLAAASPEVVSTDRIVETLWNGSRPPSARKSLQAHLVRLRSALEPDRANGSTGRYVLRRGPGYALAAAANDVDALHVVDLAARGRARLNSGDAAEAARLLSTALALWRGEPYGDWPDASFADAERRRLAEVRTDAVTALLEARLALGEHTTVVAEAERLLSDDPLQEEWWRLLVLALYRCGRQGDALAAVGRARAVLVAHLGVEPGPRLRAAEAAVLAQDPALDWLPLPSRPPPDVAVCPYKGLATYQAADAALFHGRSRLVTRLVGRLVDAPQLVVSGASGAGKSSLVRAGLVPALAGGALPGSDGWQSLVVTPGRIPMDALAGLPGVRPPPAPVVLVCDQFEELWAPGIDPMERRAFIDALLRLLDDGILARCVVVVRGDHLGRLAEHPAFAERLGSAIVLVPALTEPELSEVVREPAASVGLTAEAELLDAVVADVGGRPAALPLLSTALVGTWERRRGNRLTLAGYLEAGGVAGALSRSAEDAYAALDERGRALARRLLVRLADIDDGGALVRRPVLLAELGLDAADGAGRRAVVDTFVVRRLLVVDGDRLDVAHEALLTAWPRLARWLEDDAVGRAVRRHLTPAALEWHRRGEPQEELYRGARLGAALDWAAGAPDEPTAVERSFLDASQARAGAELTEARERARQEAVARRRTRRLAVVLATVLVVALVATGLAVRARSAAEQASQAADRASLVADANRLAALSTTVGSPDLSFLLAAQGFRLADTPETQDGLLAALAGHRRAVRAVPFPGGLVSTDLGNGGQTLFIQGVRGLVAWEVFSDELPRVLDLSADDWSRVTAAAASPTEAVAALVGFDVVGVDETVPWVRMVNADGAVRPVLSGNALGGTPLDVSFTADGRLVDILVAAPSDDGAGTTWRLVQIDPADGTRAEAVVSGVLPTGDLDADISEDRSIAVVWSQDDNFQATILDLGTGAATRVSLPDRGAVAGEYRALESGAAQLWLDGVVTLHDRSGRVTQQLDAHEVRVNDMVLAPGGTWAATVDHAGGIVLWGVDPVSGRWSQRESLRHGAGALQAQVSPDGSRLFTVSRDTVIVWDVGPGGGFGESHPGIPGRWVANPPELIEPGGLLVAPTRPVNPLGALPQEFFNVGEGSQAVAATFLDPRTGEVVEEVVVGDTWKDVEDGASVAVSPDRRRVAVTSGLATTVLDTRTREQIAKIGLHDGLESLDAFTADSVWSAAWTKDGARLLLGASGASAAWTGAQDSNPGGDIVVVDTSTWTEVDRVAIDVIPDDIELDPSGRFLAAVSPLSSETQILDADTLEVIDGFTVGLNDRLIDVSFSPDGRLLAGAGIWGALHVVDTATWDVREPVLITENPLLQVEWLDDRTVVTSALDGTVSVFDTERALVRAPPLPASDGGIRGYTKLAPATDGEIMVLNDQHAALSYPMNPAVWLREACAVAGRDLTRDEWDRYLPGREYEPTCTDLG